MDSSESLVSVIKDLLYGGIDPTIPGHGGEECTNFLDRKLMIMDTAIGNEKFRLNFCHVIFLNILCSYCNNDRSFHIFHEDLFIPCDEREAGESSQ